jgi:hypothetical protein
MHHPIPTAGTFGYEPYQRTSLGINRGIETHTLYMNVRTAQMITDRNGDAEKAKQLMLQVGMLSSTLEHQVPEQMFYDSDNLTSLNGFSTAKALQLAIQQDQRIYTIDQNNQSQALSNLRLDTVAMSEINSALASGREVTTHTDQLTVLGFRGSGYAIIDAVTGEGVYKISGGKNGAFIAGAVYAAGMVALITAIGLGTAGLGTLAAAYLMAASLSILVASLDRMYGDDPIFWTCFVAGASSALSAGGILRGYQKGIKALLIASLAALGKNVPKYEKCFR